MDYQYRILEQEEVYRGFFRLSRYAVDFALFSGGMSGRVVRECSTASGYTVAALPYDPERQEFLLIEQFRIGAMVAGVHPWQLEVVAGFMDKPGESPQDCIQRELQEEIGLRADALEHVYTCFNSPGGSAAQMHFYLARVDARRAARHTGLHEEGEDIRVHRVTYKQALDWLQRGEVRNNTLILALQAFLLRDRAAAELWYNRESHP